MIKDSGERTEFSTGAVRDMREGKGRCDLMPLDIVAEVFEANDGYREVFEYLNRFLIDHDVEHIYAAIRHVLCAEDMFDGCVCTMLLEDAVHFEEGAKKYGENNWQKGLPISCYIDSAIRHYLKWKRGDNDERHDRAFIWNLLCCAWEIKQDRKAKLEYIQQFERERDALMADLTLVCGGESINPCLACSHYRTDWEKPGCELNGLTCA